MLNRLDPYHPHGQRNRKVNLTHKITASDTVSAFIKELVSSGVLLPEVISLKGYRIRTLEEAGWVQKAMNNPSSRYSSIYNIQSQHQTWQQFEFVPSNLNNGFLFYFICRSCEKRVKDLYMPEGQVNYFCRVCHKLSYLPARQKTVEDETLQERLGGPVTTLTYIS